MDELSKFLKEDVGNGDITTDAVVLRSAKATAEIVAKEEGILAGIKEVAQLLGQEGLYCKTSFRDGDEIKNGSVVLEVSGSARKILKTERLALNILMRMSGIATHAKALSKKANPYGVTIAGTRKTTPGFRYFEKKAIKVGGGHPHRRGLDDAFLIKDNHIKVVGLKEAIGMVKKSKISKDMEVEVSNKKDALLACRIGADIIMLDNMDPQEIEETIGELQKKGLRSGVKIELSGGITLENLETYLRLRPDMISIGALTTNSKWLDMSLRIKIDKKR